jgi:hypothetical protein
MTRVTVMSVPLTTAPANWATGQVVAATVFPSALETPGAQPVSRTSSSAQARMRFFMGKLLFAFIPLLYKTCQ